MGIKFFLKRVIIMTGACFLSCSSNLVLSDENNGSSQVIETGKVIEVKLEGQMSTGYAWALTPNDFFAQEGEPKIIPVDTGKTGGKDIEVFYLKALKAGETKLVFTYQRKWEKKPPVKEYSINIVINEGGGRK